MREIFPAKQECSFDLCPTIIQSGGPDSACSSDPIRSGASAVVPNSGHLLPDGPILLLEPGPSTSPANPAVIKAIRVGQNVIDYATGRKLPPDKLSERLQ